MAYVIRKATADDFQAGATVSFWYKDYLRTVMVEKVQPCKNKNVVVMGLDVDKNERRSFTLKEIEIDSRY